MLEILAEKIHDNRFLRLLRNMLQAGYLEDWEWNATLSGAPQGGVVSPILSNIYLDRLDKFVETVLIPEYTRGKLRRHNPEYRKVQYALAQARKRGDRAEARRLREAAPRPAHRGSPRSRLPAVCATAGTQMTTSSGSPDPKPRPSRSSSAWPGSCVTISSWNCPRRRR